MKTTTTYFFAKLSAISAVILLFTITACQKEDCSGPKPHESTDVSADGQNGQIIPGKYIVVFKKSAIDNSRLSSNLTYAEKNQLVRNEANAMLSLNNVSADAIGATYNKTVLGFSATLSVQQMETLKSDARVEYIEPDRIVALGKPGSGGTTQPVQKTPYGITRVGSADGTGKKAWIIDTGIDLDHPDLNVDVTRSISFLTSGPSYTSPNDGNGHGTHVAGTIAAKNNAIGVVGVAANATVIAVRVLNNQGSGSTSGVIAGIDYVAAHAAVGDVANMSLGGGISITLDNAVIAAASNGILFALAAGNESDDANNHSPARANGTNVFTVSAMDVTDKWAYFSNYGTAVDYCAPGVNIYSTWKDAQYNTISGTSMATPHLAGILLITGGLPTTSGYVIGDPDGNADPIAHL
ncbi:MAG: S8 family peptidase [Bacteroidetes bacterium]|nr:S8 family peptidase [Bacteroidota bacterium]